MTINITLVKDRVRAFYATGLKSSNKVYSSSEAERLSQTEFDALQKGWFNKLLSSGKVNTRNENQPGSDTHRQDLARDHPKCGELVLRCGQGDLDFVPGTGVAFR
jgi:hypothetical protein